MYTYITHTHTHTHIHTRTHTHTHTEARLNALQYQNTGQYQLPRVKHSDLNDKHHMGATTPLLGPTII